MLAHRLRRWSNIEPTLGECLLFLGGEGGVDSCVPTIAMYTFTQCWVIADPQFATMAQR